MDVTQHYGVCRKEIFLTKGVGKTSREAFELSSALRNAGIAACKHRARVLDFSAEL